MVFEALSEKNEDNTKLRLDLTKYVIGLRREAYALLPEEKWNHFRRLLLLSSIFAVIRNVWCAMKQYKSCQLIKPRDNTENRDRTIAHPDVEIIVICYPREDKIENHTKSLFIERINKNSRIEKCMDNSSLDTAKERTVCNR